MRLVSTRYSLIPLCLILMSLIGCATTDFDHYDWDNDHYAPALPDTILVAHGNRTTGKLLRYQWTAPTTGSPVRDYVVEERINGSSYAPAATVSGTTVTLRFPWNALVQIRCAGVDSLDRQGLWSPESDPYRVPRKKPRAHEDIDVHREGGQR
ncbi:MAG: hypothetical protein GY906_12260 [bacterium]|nr:hypothetical protein [bacterium]